MPAETIAVPVDSATSAEYTIPLTGGFKVQSVVATVDTSGGAATPQLTVTNAERRVIATKLQTAQLNAGAPGETAAWELRTADEGSGPTPDADDYVFVAAGNEAYNPTNVPVDFVGIPQDARHLVIYGIAYVQGDLVITINGDVTAGHYRSLTETTLDTAGVITTVLSDDGASGAIVVPNPCGFAGASAGNAPARFKIDVPYYRIVPGHSFGGQSNRSLHVEAWAYDNEPVHGVNAWKHVETVGFWQPTLSGVSCPEITRITLRDSTGLSFLLASLDKVI